MTLRKAGLPRIEIKILNYSPPRPKRSILRPSSWFAIMMAILMALRVALVRWAKPAKLEVRPGHHVPPMNNVRTTQGRWPAKRSDGRPCEIKLVAEWEEVPPEPGDHEPTLQHVRDYLFVGRTVAQRIAQGKYRLPSGEIVTCPDPSAP